MSEFKDSRSGSFCFERKIWLMLVGLLLSALELSNWISVHVRPPGSINLFSIVIVTLFSLGDDHRTIGAEGSALFA
jgi:hypothetical protein